MIFEIIRSRLSQSSDNNHMEKTRIALTSSINMQLTAILLFVSLALSADATFYNDEHVNFIDEPGKSGIDFSRGHPGPDGTVCVQRQKFVDKTEKDQLKECFVQNVTQCYYTYVTEYKDSEQEKCEDFYWKSCKIVFKSRSFNATSRICKRPLVKHCADEKQQHSPPAKYAPNAEKLVCQTFFETECNTTDIIPYPGDEPLSVTFCEKLPRQVCAPDRCQVVEGAERCTEETVESLVEQPTELCDLQAQQVCSTAKVSVPSLVPEKKCRQTEKQICNSRFINPHSVQKTLHIKYCARPEKLASTSSYIQPSSPVYSSPVSNSAYPSSQSLPPPSPVYTDFGPPPSPSGAYPPYQVPPPQPFYSSPPSPASNYASGARPKRFPEEEEGPLVVDAAIPANPEELRNDFSDGLNVPDADAIQERRGESAPPLELLSAPRAGAGESLAENQKDNQRSIEYGNWKPIIQKSKA